MNIPYVKKYDESGVCTNPITKANPYLHKEKSARGKSGPRYVSFHHPITGAYMGQVKSGGNNRKFNKRTGKRRTIKLA